MDRFAKLKEGLDRAGLFPWVIAFFVSFSVLTGDQGLRVNGY